MTALPTTIEATRAELDQLNATIVAAANNPHWNYGRSRTKAFGRRTDAAIHRTAQCFARVKALEAHLVHLQAQETAAQAPAPKPVSMGDIWVGMAVKTKSGWFRVVKINRTTVTVDVEPGWDDIVPLSRVLEVRELPHRAGKYLVTLSNAISARSGSMRYQRDTLEEAREVKMRYRPWNNTRVLIHVTTEERGKEVYVEGDR